MVAALPAPVSTQRKHAQRRDAGKRLTRYLRDERGIQVHKVLKHKKDRRGQFTAAYIGLMFGGVHTPMVTFKFQ